MIKPLIVLLWISIVYGFETGVPEGACDSMTPDHGVASQKCQANYIVESDKTDFNPGDRIRISIRGATDADHFKGFFLLAKSDTDQKIIGTWTETNTSMKTVSCNNIAKSGIGHSSADEKHRIEAIWNSPSTISDENIIIKLTIVKSYEEIHVNCFNLTLRARKVNSSIHQTALKDENSFEELRTNVTWTHKDGIVTMTMVSGQVQVNQWRSIGFSIDEEMGDEYIFICQISGSGNVTLRRMHTKPGKRSPSPSVEDVNVIRAVYENGFATCEFSFDIITEETEGEPAPLGTDIDYYILYAAGILKNTEQIAKHNQTFVTPKTYQLQNHETINLDQSMAVSSTSLSTISSATVTTTATSESNIGADITWTHKNGVTNVQMLIKNLKAAQWFALALSTDKKMGEDHLFSCERLSDDRVSIRRMINPGGYTRPTIFESPIRFNISRQKFENGFVYCDFTVSNFDDTKRTKRQTALSDLSSSTMYIPLVAMGNLDGSNTMMRHSQSGRHVLNSLVVLNRQESISYNSESNGFNTINLMKAHGIILIFAWIVVVSTGILIARYFKRAWSNRKICGKAVWFAIHRALMSSASILSLIALILILVYKKGQWTSSTNQTEFIHSIVGIIVISFATIQPFMALFRCNPDDDYRFIFNYCHAFVGLSAFILSIAAIFLAMFFNQFEFNMTKEWAILVVWSCWLPIVFILFETIEICFQRLAPSEEVNSYSLNNYPDSTPGKAEPIGKAENKNENRIKILLLAFHVLIATGLALALMILIGRS